MIQLKPYWRTMPLPIDKRRNIIDETGSRTGAIRQTFSLARRSLTSGA